MGLKSAPCVTLCKVGDVEPGSAIKIEHDQMVLAVFNIHGEYYVTDDACTHGPGSLSEGYIDGDIVECDFHNGSFNIKTGQVTAPPCLIPLRTYKAIVKEGEVCVDANSLSTKLS